MYYDYFYLINDLCVYIRVSIAVVYDGHARNTTNLGLNVFMTFSVASVTELPAGLVVVFFLDKWGRRALAFGSLLGSAVFSLATLAVPSGSHILLKYHLNTNSK